MSNLISKQAVCRLLIGLVILCTVSCTVSCAGRNKGGNGAATTLTIKGSDTMVHLVSAWAEAYMQEYPETEILVTGGGSGTGFAALLNRTTDICAASREMMPKELELAEVRGIVPSRTLVARDGIAVIVHPSNQIGALTVEQIRKIFTGAYDNWSQVGGADRKIVVFSRDTSSGTFFYFQEHVLQKQDFRQDARLLPATSTIVQSVAEDMGAIGYVGLGYALESRGSIKSLAIRNSEQELAVEPTIDSVRLADYVIVRPLRLYTAGERSDLVRSFITFCLGTRGQEIVHQSGYVTAE